MTEALDGDPVHVVDLALLQHVVPELEPLLHRVDLTHFNTHTESDIRG